MARPPLKDFTAMITGASSGIGREIALELAPNAHTVILVARRVDRLEQLKSELVGSHPNLQVKIAPCDLTDLSAIDTMLEQLGREIGVIDVLVNNAGLGDVSLFHATSHQKLDWMLRVNINALTHLTHRLLGPMIAQHKGGILNISSSFAFTFMPGFAAYAASKMYVTGLTEAIRLELAGTGVTITQVCPGPVKTEFEAVAGNPLGTSVPSYLEMSAKRCAKISVRGFRRGCGIVIPGLLMKTTVIVLRLTPQPLLRFIYRFVARTFRKAKSSKPSA
jgi:short-subunit dehydrogenase